MLDPPALRSTHRGTDHLSALLYRDGAERFASPVSRARNTRKRPPSRMLSQQSTTKPRTLDELLGKELMARLDRLDVLSRKVFAGKMPGERRSKRRGQSVEFDDFRPYVPGDDLRHIDWNILARLDKLVLKLFKEDEDLSLSLIVDCSASMDAGEPSKIVFAHKLAMALGYMGLVNHNRVSVATFGSPVGGGGLTRLAAMRGRKNVRRLSEFLLSSLNPETISGERRENAPPQDFNDLMRLLALSRQGKGVIVLISDMLLPEGYLPGLNFLSGAAGHDAYVVQVLSPDELDPARQESAILGDLRLTDAETGRASEVTISAAVIAKYREKLNAHIDGLAHACRARDITHMLAASDARVDEMILDKLRRRGLVR